MENITENEQLEVWPIKFASLGECLPKGDRVLYQGVYTEVGVHYVEE
jgi:hypothetical protein